jgi:hypothetical protein
MFGKSASLFACCNHTFLFGLSLIKQTLYSIQITLMFDVGDISEIAQEEFMKMVYSTGRQ